MPATFRMISGNDQHWTITIVLELLTLWCSPARQLASKLDTNILWSLQFPWKVGHNVDSISATNTDGDHAKATSIWSVGISANHETTWECVVFQNNLMNDTRSRAPETNVVFGAGSGQKVVDLLVDALRPVQVLIAADLSFDQVIAMDGGWSGHGWHTGRHELENSHLGSGILAGDSVGSESQVGCASFNVLTFWIVEMGVQNLLAEGEWAV